MRVPRLYCPVLAAGANALSKEESHHAAKVLRLRQGDRVSLFDGLGHEGRGAVSGIRPQQVEVAVDSITTRPFETVHRITLAVALAKAHRHGYLVEKCTELGAAGFWPILAERSVTEPGEAAVEKWSRRAIEAAKQSHRVWLPTFEELQPISRAIERIPEFTAAAVADPEGADFRPAFLSCRPADATLLVFVGPEGGFTQSEREQLIAAGAHPVRLAPTVLRTETAAVALCAAEAALSLSLAGRGSG